MMSMRGFWILSLQKRSLIYSKTFPVFENKARKMSFDPFFPVRTPEDEVDLIDGILLSLGVLNRDESSPKKNQLPTIELSYRGSVLWPVLVCEQSGNLFCALPLIEDPSKEIIDHLSISPAFSFLQKVMQIFSSVGNDFSKLMEIETFICATAPLGRYVCGEVASLPKGKQSNDDNSISITVNEKISCDTNGTENINGIVSVEPQLHSNINRTNVSLKIISLNRLDIILPSCCSKNNEDVIRIERLSSKQNLLYKLKQEYLCSKHNQDSLIQYDYKVTRDVKEGSNFKITLSLQLKKLDSKFKVSELNVFWKPSSSLLRLVNMDCSHGSVSQETKTTGVTWILGSKLPKFPQKAVFVADILCQGSPSSDLLTASCVLRLDNLTSALILSRDNISIVKESVASSPSSVKLLFQKSLSSTDYHLTATLV